MKESGGGTFTEVKEEKGLMDVVTGTKYAVVHFFKMDFGRCGIMDRHLDVSFCFPQFVKVRVRLVMLVLGWAMDLC